MATSNKYGVGLFNTRNDATAWSVLDHTGIGSDAPQIFWSAMIGATTPGQTLAHNRFSWGIATFSSDGTKQNNYIAYRNQDGLTSPNHDIVGDNSAGPGWIEAGVNDIYRINVTSPIPGGFQNQRALAGFEFTNSPLYATAFLTGSLTYRSQYGQPLNAASGSTVIESIGFTPDIVFSYVGWDYEAGDGFLVQLNNAFGFTDCRSPGRAAYIGNTYWDAADDTSIRMLSRSALTLPNYDNGGGRLAIEMNTVNANGFGWSVTENNSGYIFAQDISYLAIKFNDTTVNWRVDMFTTPSTAAGNTGRIQMNSLQPEFVSMFGSNVQTLDFLVNSNSTHGDTQAFGFAASHKAVGATVSEDTAGSTGTNNFTYGPEDIILNTFSINGGTRYFITSLDFQSGYLGFTISGAPLSWPDQWVGYLAIGEAVNAPDHVQDEAGGSIFLTESENFDDLLLTESAPVGIQFVRRDYPRHDDRDYPVPINEVRNYPNE